MKNQVKISMYIEFCTPSLVLPLPYKNLKAQEKGAFKYVQAGCAPSTTKRPGQQEEPQLSKKIQLIRVCMRAIVFVFADDNRNSSKQNKFSNLVI